MKSGKPAAGFTLIEILVVVVIIGVLAGLVSLSIGGGERREVEAEAEAEAKRLHHLLHLAADMAMETGQELGLRVAEKAGIQQYEMMMFDHEAQNWVPHQDRVFARHSVSEIVRMEVTLESQELSDALDALEQIDEDKLDKKSNKNRNDKPIVLILSSGEMTALTIRFSAENYSAILIADGAGEVFLQTDNQ